VRLVTYHLGFLRIALSLGTPVVPVFGFGEHDVMDNVQMPRVQRWFLKRFRFAFPVMPMGLAGLPLPRKTPLTVVVGRAIDPVAIREAMRAAKASDTEFQRTQRQIRPRKKTVDASTAVADEDAEVVDVLADIYFNELRRVFYEHRSAAGYPELELEFL
jgi:1-acyl-sn-glycerol-3-phosphate acyltransferase